MFNLANIATSLNLICGILAIILALVGRIDLAPFLIFAGAIFDFFDGFIARKLGQQSEMGKQLDSLADIVSFGVAPGIIMFVVLIMHYHSYLNSPYAEVIQYDIGLFVSDLLDGTWYDFVPFVAMLIPFFALFRLAKFNIDTRQTDSFLGLPTPAATLFFMAFPLVLTFPQYTPEFILNNLDVIYNRITLSVVIILVSLLMVIEIPLFSLKFKSFDIKANLVRYQFLLISIVLIVLFKTLSIALIVILYVLISILATATTKNKKNEIQS